MIYRRNGLKKMSKTLNTFLNTLQEEWKSGRDGKRLVSVSIHPILAEDIEEEGGVTPSNLTYDTFFVQQQIMNLYPFSIGQTISVFDNGFVVGKVKNLCFFSQVLEDF